MRKLLLMLAGLALGTPAMAADAPADAPLVLTARALAVTDARLTGTVAPQVSVNLGFPVMGRLLSRDAEVGAFVHATDHLAQIEATAYLAGIDAAEAGLREARARMENAMSVSDRQQALLERDITSATVVEAATTQLDQSRAEVVAAQAALDQAEEQWTDTALVAPFDGVVIAASGAPGQIVSPGETVITLARPDLRDAMVDVPERLLARLPVGTPMKLALELDPALTAAGTVRQIAPAADPVTGLYRLRIALENTDPAFRFGSTVTVEIPDSAAGHATLVPATALFRRDGATMVWTLGDDCRISARTVEPGATTGATVEISAGLAAGETVIIAGVGLLNDGQCVRSRSGSAR